MMPSLSSNLEEHLTIWLQLAVSQGIDTVGAFSNTLIHATLPAAS